MRLLYNSFVIIVIYSERLFLYCICESTCLCSISESIHARSNYCLFTSYNIFSVRMWVFDCRSLSSHPFVASSKLNAPWTKTTRIRMSEETNRKWIIISWTTRKYIYHLSNTLLPNYHADSELIHFRGRQYIIYLFYSSLIIHDILFVFWLYFAYCASN